MIRYQILESLILLIFKEFGSENLSVCRLKWLLQSDKVLLNSLSSFSELLDFGDEISDIEIPFSFDFEEISMSKFDSIC